MAAAELPIKLVIRGEGTMTPPKPIEPAPETEPDHG
jgi:hypothetical protein